MFKVMRFDRVVVIILVLAVSMYTSASEINMLPKAAPGKFFPLKAADHKDAATFEAGEPVVGTTYFYWYDVESKAHIIDGDGSDALTTHPNDLENISYKSASWHRGQMLDMIDAGIDFLMPVFWGVPGKYDGWSFAGLPPMVEAHNQLQKEGKKPPAIGLFYDTSILAWNEFNEDGSNYHVDLTTEFGKEWLYTAARDFFSFIPLSKWARVDGRPIVFLYSAGFAEKQAEGQLEYFKKRFRGDFGIEPFVVKNADWIGRAEATYSWGGAVNGPLLFEQTIALGPGYDHSAVPGRTPLVVDRAAGKTYIDRWLKVLSLNAEHRPWMVHVETWNEWHEGTDVADSSEYGRSYIVLTKLFSDMWRAKTSLRLVGSYAQAERVSWRAGDVKGLELRASSGDGIWKERRFETVQAVVSEENPHSATSRFLYFNIDDAFAFDLYDKTVTVKVGYRDSGCERFWIEYDNVDATKGPMEGAFRSAGGVEVGDTGKWKTAMFELSQCRFMNRCNLGDFRIAVSGGDLSLAVRGVQVDKK